MEDYYEYLDSNGVTTLYKLIKDDTVALIDSYSVTVNGITTTLDTHINDSDIHTPISDIENMVDAKISGLVNSAPETLDTLKELSDALGNDPNFATTVANQIGNKASKDSVYTKEETNTLLEGKANSVHSHVVSDITDFPTIPTKVSDLTNDSGYITGIAWGDITNKPSFSDIAISGSYTDLSNTPIIPTKVSQLENDTGFINALTDVVDTKSNQTINGTKTFTVGPVASNYATTNGYFIKVNAIARNEVPTQLYHATFRALDKNGKILGEYCIEKSNSGSTLAHINVHSEDSNGKQLSESLYLNMSNDGSAVRFYPSSDNKMDLGMLNNKWANAYIGRVVCTRFTHSVNNGSVYITGGSEWDKGATLVLYGEDSSDAGSFIINSRDKTRSLYLVGKPDGTLQWAGQNIALDGNLVHRSGNETITGTKMFTNNIHKKNSGLDLQVNPSANQYSGIIFTDKNNVFMAYLEHTQTTAGINIIGVYARDKSNGTHGIQITSENNIIPLGDNTYNLGLSGARWKSVYATTYYGNLVGDITLNQTSLKMTVKDSNSDTTRTDNVLLANSSNTGSGINAAFGGRSNTVVGAGESCVSQLNDLLGNASENLYLVSDGHIYIKVGANTYANAKVITLNSSAELSGLAKVTATTFVGALIGNVTGNCSGSSGSCTGNSASATKASYLDNYSNAGGNKIYLDWDQQVKGYVGLKVDNTTMGGLITTKNIGSQAVNSATYSTTPATTDNSTRIATTAWVRTYVNSVVGSGSVGASISAYYSNATTLTATGSTTGNPGLYPAAYSNYINIAPTVGTIYTGSQLFSSFTPTASGTINKVSTGPSSVTYNTTASAKATFSGAFSASAKYLCTTANAVKFRAYVSQGTSSNMGSPSVVNQSSAKSIFIRVQ